MPQCKWCPPNSEREEDRCKYDAFGDYEECIFHIGIQEKEKIHHLEETFISDLKESIKNLNNDFIGFKFPGKFNFRKHGIPVLGALGSKVANFKWAEFGDDVSFAGVSFYRGGNFDRAVFHGKADFSRATFDDKTGFQSTTFIGEVSFTQIKTKRKETLDYAGLEGGPFEAGAPWLIFNKTVFVGPTMIRRNDLSNTRFQSVDLSNVSFIDSTINRTRFIDCQWGGGLESKKKYRRKDRGLWCFRQPRLMFDELLLRKYRSKDRERYSSNGEPVERVSLERSLKPGDIEVLGLQLKQSLESMRDPITAGDFHFCSMEMKRLCALDDCKNDKKIFWFRVARFLRASTLWLYKMVNGYGERYGRTLFWLLSLVLFSSIYFIINDDFIPNGWSPEFPTFAPVITWPDYFLYSLQNILPLKIGQQFIHPAGPGARWASFLETFLGTTFFAFFILALRRRFKR